MSWCLAALTSSRAPLTCQRRHSPSSKRLSAPAAAVGLLVALFSCRPATLPLRSILQWSHDVTNMPPVDCMVYLSLTAGLHQARLCATQHVAHAASECWRHKGLRTGYPQDWTGLQTPPHNRVSRRYFHKGSLAYVGGDRAVMDIPTVGPIFGREAGVMWKGYETFAQVGDTAACQQLLQP